MTSLIPAKNVVILRQIQVTKTGGIVIPESNDPDHKKPDKGEVVAVGSGKQPFGDFIVEVGDIVFYEKYTENRMYHKDSYFNFVKFNKIYAIEKNEKNTTK